MAWQLRAGGAGCDAAALAGLDTTVFHGVASADYSIAVATIPFALPTLAGKCLLARKTAGGPQAALLRARLSG